MAYVTIADIAAELRVSYDKARRLVIGEIGGLQLGGPHTAWRVDRRDYRDYLSKSRKGGDAGTDDRAAGNHDDYKTG